MSNEDGQHYPDGEGSGDEYDRVPELQDVNQSCSSNGNSSSNGNVYYETSNGAGQHNPDGEDSGDEYDRVPELQDDSSDEEGENDEENDEEGDEREKDVEGKFAEDYTVWKLPVRTFLRGLYPGIVPEELRVLTLVEISMVSLYNPITRISMGKVSFYHGKGNMYTIINDITRVAQSLPSMPKLDEFATLRYVNEKGNESDFSYRPNRVRIALDWLKKNNHLYQDVPIVYPEDWPDEHTEAGEQCIDIVPLEVTVEEAETLQEARKEAMEMEDSNISTNTGTVGVDQETLLATDVDLVTQLEDLKRKLQPQPDKVFTRVQSESEKVNIFNNPEYYWEKAFPTLYPYGLGGPSNAEFGFKRMSDYHAHILKRGGGQMGRRFQNNSGSIFATYTYTMKQKANNMAFAATKDEVDPSADTDITKVGMVKTLLSSLQRSEQGEKVVLRDNFDQYQREQKELEQQRASRIDNTNSSSSSSSSMMAPAPLTHADYRLSLNDDVMYR
eukprot:gene15499-17722_t